MKRVLGIVLLLTHLLWAETIKEIKFEGLIHISPMVATDIIGLQRGDELDIQKIDQAIVKFFDQGFFQDIWVTEDEGTVTFHFKELPIIAKVDITGYKEGDAKKDLIDALGIKKGDVYKMTRINQAKRDLTDTAEAEGYFDTIVEVETEELNENSLALTFVMNKGEYIVIEKSTFCGANELDQWDFESVSANREYEFMGWMWGRNDGKLKLQELPLDSQRMKDLYMQKGYLDAEVSNPFLKTNFDTYQAEMTYYIDEGDLYTVSGINIAYVGDEIVPIDELMESIKSDVDDTFNINEVRTDMKRIQRKVANQGYAFARVEPDMDKDTQTHTVKLDYTILPGKKVWIDDVLVSGNTRTLDRVIRREILLAPGDLYSLDDLEESRKALGRSGYFEDVKIEEERVSQDKMRLLVNVKEAMTGEFKFGVSYGSYGGLGGSVSISDRNVLGSGLKASASIDTSDKNNRYKLSLYNPRIYDSKYSLGTEIFKTNYESYDYTEDRAGFGITLGKFLTQHLRATLGYEYTITELTDVNASDNNRFAKYYKDGEFSKSSIIPGLKYNSTDDYLLPRAGIIMSSSLDIAGLGGDEDYWKLYITFSYFKSLEDVIDYDLILRYKARGGYLWDNGYLPINQKFYLGGITTLRGYKSSSLSPRDDEDFRIGGKQFFSHSLEASLPILEGIKMRLALFYDFGMIGEENLDEISRSSVGTAVEWISPLGPINLIFPFPLDDKKGDDTSSFEFTMGTRF